MQRMLDNCRWLTVLQLVMPLLCVLNFAPCVARYGFMWAGLAGIALYQVILFTTPLALGMIGSLDQSIFRIVYVGLAAALAIRGLFCVWPLIKAVGKIRYRPQIVDLFICGCFYLFGSILVYELVRAWKWGPSEYDAISYHIPRAMLWSWHGNLVPWATANWQQVGSALGGSASLLPSVFLGCGYLNFSWAGVLYGIGGGFGVFVIARSFGLSGRAACLAMLVFLTFPSTLMRVRGVSSDIAAAFPVIAGFALFRSIENTKKGVIVFLALLGLGMACKQYIFFSGAFVIVVLAVTLRRQLLTKAMIVPACAGAMVALFFLFLSYYEVYAAFGDIAGGSMGRDHSTVAMGFKGVKDSVVYNILAWITEPLSVLERSDGELWFKRLGFVSIYEFFGLPAGIFYLPQYNGHDLRSGVIALVALPWLIGGIAKGYRTLVVVGFLLFVAIQVAPISLNLTGRFLTVPLACFAVFWGLRARTRPILVSLFVIAALLVTRSKLGMAVWVPEVSAQWFPERGECGATLAQSVNKDTLLLLTRSLATDAVVSGREGEIRFEYVSCPDDNNWPALFTRLREQYKWFAMYPDQGKLSPGPKHETTFKRSCGDKTVTLEELRSWLTGAGWHFVGVQKCGIDLWTTDHHNASVSHVTRPRLN